MHSFHFALHTALRHLFGLHTVGIENLADNGRPLVIVGNHANFLDVPILGSYFSKRLVYPIFLGGWSACISNIQWRCDIYPTNSSNPQYGLDCQSHQRWPHLPDLS